MGDFTFNSLKMRVSWTQRELDVLELAVLEVGPVPKTISLWMARKNVFKNRNQVAMRLHIWRNKNSSDYLGVLLRSKNRPTVLPGLNLMCADETLLSLIEGTPTDE